MGFSKSWKAGLLRQPSWVVSVYGAVAAFAVYFCMYAFRKPFTAAAFEGLQWLGVSYKAWLVTAQLAGYTCSKFYGIRFIATLTMHKRAITIVALIFIAWMALLLFAVLPSPLNIFLLFVNGFPLGLVWGIVFSYLEGRRATEAMGAVLASSFIVSSGMVKSIGKYSITQWGIAEAWMPFVTGALFIIPLFFFVYLLAQMPAPSQADIAQRTARRPMQKKERRAFLLQFAPGLFIIVLTYTLLTMLRDFRDNFANEIWAESGFGAQPAIFTTSEIPVSLVVLACMALLVKVRDNLRAFMINHAIIMVGYALSISATLLFIQHVISPVLWMVVVGIGLYLAYVPFNALYFERMIATYKIKGNVGFIMYLADSAGYLGSMGIVLLKEFYGLQLSWTSFFIRIVLTASVIGLVASAIAAVYFYKKYHSLPQKIAAHYAL